MVRARLQATSQPHLLCARPAAPLRSQQVTLTEGGRLEEFDDTATLPLTFMNAMAEITTVMAEKSASNTLQCVNTLSPLSIVLQTPHNGTRELTFLENKGILRT